MNADKEFPMGILFGGNQTWQQREESFVLKPSMKVSARCRLSLGLCEDFHMPVLKY